jgi:hypothetical protein
MTERGEVPHGTGEMFAGYDPPAGPVKLCPAQLVAQILR